jgi:hypothetical protein
VQVLWHGQSFHVSLVACGNAAGKFLAPTLIFEGVRPKKAYINGFPEARLVMTESGYQELAAFLAWSCDFVEQTKGNCILIVDNHATRRSLAALEVFIENKVTVVTLPPHTTHVTQPLDVAFFRPFKAHLRKVITEVEGGGTRVTKVGLAGVVKRAWDLATAPAVDPRTGAVSYNITSGFKATGIWPLDPSKVIRPEVTGHGDRLEAARDLVALGGGDAAAPRDMTDGDDEDDAIVAGEGLVEDDALDGTTAEHKPTAAEIAAAVDAALTVPPELLTSLREHNAKSKAQKATILTSQHFIAEELRRADAAKAAEEEKKARDEDKKARKAQAEAQKAEDVARKAAAKRKREDDAEKKALIKTIVKGPPVPADVDKAQWDDQKGPGIKVRLRLKGQDNKDLDLPAYNLSFRSMVEAGAQGAAGGNATSAAARRK